MAKTQTRRAAAPRRLSPATFLTLAVVASVGLLLVFALAWNPLAGQSQAGAAPDVAIATVDGQPFSLTAQRGKAVVLYFMAGWCATCIPEARALARLRGEYSDRDLQVLLVDAEASETPAGLAGFQRAVPGAERLLWAIDHSGVLIRAFAVRSLDTTVVFDRQGQVVYRDEVPTPYETLKRALERAL